MNVIVMIVAFILTLTMNLTYKKRKNKNINLVLTAIIFSILWASLDYMFITFKTPEKCFEYRSEGEKISDIYEFNNSAVIFNTMGGSHLYFKRHNRWQEKLSSVFSKPTSFKNCVVNTKSLNNDYKIFKITCSLIDGKKENKIEVGENSTLKKVDNEDSYYGLIKKGDYLKINDEKINIED